MGTLLCLGDALDAVLRLLDFQTRHRLAQTCKSLRNKAIDDEFYRQSLLQDFHLAVKDLPSTTHRELYKRLYATRGQRDPVVRFKAASTDGGVDHSARFWVDNMFVPGVADAYCSHRGHDVSILAVLTDSAVVHRVDSERERHVAFLRRILDAAVTGLEGANADFERRGVDTWPLFDLEDLLAQCWLPDSWLRARVSGALDELARETGESRAALEADVERIVRETGRRRVLRAQERRRAADPKKASATWRPCTPGHLLHPFYRIIQARRDDRDLLLDGALAPAALLPPAACMGAAALLSAVSINRHGGFSCPVRTGAILTRVLTRGAPSAAAAPCDGASSSTSSDDGDAECEAAAAAACAMARGRWARELAACHDYASVQSAAAEGRLPRVRAARLVKPADDFVGVVVEFECPDDATEAHELWPLVWFSFFARTENEALKAWQATATPHIALGRPPPPPLALAWVPALLAPPPRPRGERVSDKRPRAAGGAPSYATAHSDSAASGSGRTVSSCDSHAVEVSSIADSTPESPGGDTAGLVWDSDRDSEPEAAAWWEDAHAVPGGLDDSESDEEGGGEEGGAARQVLRSTRGRSMLKYKLTQRRLANCVCVQLISQENLMTVWDDRHPAPNVDVACVKFFGQVVELPAGVELGRRPAGGGVQ